MRFVVPLAVIVEADDDGQVNADAISSLVLEEGPGVTAVHCLGVASEESLKEEIRRTTEEIRAEMSRPRVVVIQVEEEAETPPLGTIVI